MATTLPASLLPSHALAGAMRVGRVASPQPGASPAAEESSSPAVVNHVRGTEPAADGGAPAGAANEGTPEEEHAEEIRALQRRDAEVRAHEQAHAATGGAYAGAASYGYQRGPDGRSYAVSGEVPIDLSTIAGDPEATIQKMQQVKRAALAPRDPSNADRAIAATADALIMAARQEQLAESGETNGAEPAATSDEAIAGAAAREAFGRTAGAAAYAAASTL